MTSRQEVESIYERPLLDLVFEAATVHRRHYPSREVQRSSLLSIKTGGCPEDCAYCPQSSRYRTGLVGHALLSPEEVEAAARRARDDGADRFCLGAAWRDVREGDEFERVLEMVRRVKRLGLETCATLGMLGEPEARRLAEAGLDFYNHNLDTSPEFYPEIIGTRAYDDRLRTLEAVRAAGMKVCCGGILGMGESHADRIGLLVELANQDPPLESVPVNALVRVEGTPLASRPSVPWDEIVRVVATARILMPRSRIRLSAGRRELSEAEQAMAFLAGANSIFLGDRLLTTPNPEPDQDDVLLAKLGLVGLRKAPAPAGSPAS